MVTHHFSTTYQKQMYVVRLSEETAGDLQHSRDQFHPDQLVQRVHSVQLLSVDAIVM